MQKALKAILAVTGRVLFIGFSIQIVLGLVWLVCNFAGFQRFGESALYEEISKTLICDEYEGILYPILIKLARGIEELVLIPYRYILYLLQLAFAYFVPYKLLQIVGVKGRFWRSWGSLVILTFPMAMQCHLAVLPDSLVCSGLLLEIAFAVKILLSGNVHSSMQLAKVLGCWLFTALLQPEYLYVGAVPAVIMFLYGLWKVWKNDKRQILYNGILVLAFAGMIAGVENLAQIEGYYGRVHQSFNASMASRFAWLYVREDYAYWPAEVTEHISYEEMTQIDHYADNADRLLGRVLEEAVGEERTEELLGELADIAWRRHSRAIFYNMAWDMAGYSFSPIVLQYQFDGAAYDSYSGRNYDIMRERTPLLTKYYMDYGCWWFAVGLFVAVLMQIIYGVQRVVEIRKRKEAVASRKGTITAIIICVCTAAALVSLYTLRGAGMMDYKKSITVTILWLLWMVNAMLREKP